MAPNDTSTLPTNATTIGLTLFGTQVAFMSGDELLAQFWATSTNTTGLWSLNWNSDGASQDDSVPVTLKVSS